MNSSIQALEDQYFLLRGSLSTLSEQGATAEQLDKLRLQIVQSRTNYWTAVNGNLQDDDPHVQQLVADIKIHQVTLSSAIDKLGNVAKVIDITTQAVNTGSQIVAKAATL